MGTLTEDHPKCQVRLHGKALIDWQLAALRGAGVTDIGIVRGYMPQAFQYPVTYFENLRWAQTNMVMSLKAAENWLCKDACIVSYSDIVYGADSVRSLMALPCDIGITYDPRWLTLWQRRFERPLDDAETFRLNGDRLLEIGHRAVDVADIQGQYMGLIKLTPTGWGQMEAYLATLSTGDQDKLSMTEMLQGLLDRDVRINVVPISGRWYEVDSASDLAVYETLPPVDVPVHAW
mgnify:FL=1